MHVLVRALECGEDHLCFVKVTYFVWQNLLSIGTQTDMLMFANPF